MTARYVPILALLLLGVICDASPSQFSRRPTLTTTTTTTYPTWMGDHCTKDSECNPGECCVYRPDRYSIPGCRRFGNEDDSCIPHAPTLNTTLYYPDSSQLQLFDVHRILCPCMEKLSCNRNGICSNSNVIEGQNVLGD